MGEHMATDEQIIEAFIAIRDGIKEMTTAFDLQVLPYKKRMDELETEMTKRLMDRGATNSKTEAGTAYISRTLSVRATDKGLFVEHVRQTQNFELMEVRPAKEAVETYMSDHEGLPPPGVDVVQIQKTNFRRS